MNQVEEFNKIVLDTVTELLNSSTETYELMRASLQLSAYNDERIHNYIHRLIDFTDEHRPKAIEQKGG